MIPSTVFVVAVAQQNKNSTLQQIIEKFWEHAKDVYTCFVDLRKIYDWVPREKLWGGECGSSSLWC